MEQHGLPPRTCIVELAAQNVLVSINFYVPNSNKWLLVHRCFMNFFCQLYEVEMCSSEIRICVCLWQNGGTMEWILSF